MFYLPYVAGRMRRVLAGHVLLSQNVVLPVIKYALLKKKKKKKNFELSETSGSILPWTIVTIRTVEAW